MRLPQFSKFNTKTILQLLGHPFAVIPILVFTIGHLSYVTFNTHVRSVYFFNQSPFDGVFQTLFPLRNIDFGSYPSIDFFYFHGNAIPYLIYPFYKFLMVFGQEELEASLNATFFVNLILLYVPLYIVMRIITNSRLAICAVLLGALLTELLPVFGYFLSANFLGAPMGIRFAPHIIMAGCVGLIAIYSAASPRPTTKKIMIALIYAGLVGAMMPYLGAEQGIYAVAGFAFAVFFIPLGGVFFVRRVLYALFFLVAFVLIFIATQLILFQSLDTIRAIMTISSNQVWVYGTFPNSFFGSFSNIFSLDMASAVPSQTMTIAGLGMLVLTIILRYFKQLDLPSLLVVTVLFMSALLSWVSNIGYVGQHQAPLFLRECVVASVVVLPSILRVVTSQLLKLTSKTRLVGSNG